MKNGLFPHLRGDSSPSLAIMQVKHQRLNSNILTLQYDIEGSSSILQGASKQYYLCHYVAGCHLPTHNVVAFLNEACVPCNQTGN